MDNTNKFNSILEATMLAFSIVLITLLHYSTMYDGNVLLHEISQRLYYIPIIYAAYRFGLKGSLAVSLLSGILYILHISEHQRDSATSVLNQYTEVLMFQIIAIATGIFAQAEQRQRQRFENASANLAKAYQELKDTVNLLVRTARLQSLGEMAAMIAHEIRNPLGAIKGAFEIIETEIPPDSSRREFADIVTREIDRLNRLVTEFLKFSRPRQPEKTLTNINELIESVVSFISPQAANTGVKLVTQLAATLPHIFIDIEQIKQVLLNLILNAIQAMPMGGLVEVGSRQAGAFAEITVRDYGVGIEIEQRDKIFDPFFTTKQAGSGLGLSVAYQLIKQHNGEIELIDHDGQGSFFLIRLPISVADEKKAITDKVYANKSYDGSQKL